MEYPWKKMIEALKVGCQISYYLEGERKGKLGGYLEREEQSRARTLLNRILPDGRSAICLPRKKKS